MSLVFLILAFLLEVLATFNMPARPNLIAAGLASYFLSLLLGALPL